MPDELNKKEQSLNTSDFNVSSNNVKGLKSSKKQLKHIQLFITRLVPNFSCFYKKRIIQKSQKKYGMIYLIATYFFHMGK